MLSYVKNVKNIEGQTSMELPSLSSAVAPPQKDSVQSKAPAPGARSYHTLRSSSSHLIFKCVHHFVRISYPYLVDSVYNFATFALPPGEESNILQINVPPAAHERLGWPLLATAEQ